MWVCARYHCLGLGGIENPFQTTFCELFNVFNVLMFNLFNVFNVFNVFNLFNLFNVFNLFNLFKIPLMTQSPIQSQTQSVHR